MSIAPPDPKEKRWKQVNLRVNPARLAQFDKAVRLSKSRNRTDLILRLLDGYLAEMGAL
jgi:hypothetical protein